MMKRFLAGLIVGLSVSALTLLAQHLASEKVVQPQPIVDNQKVKVVRWVLKPGEGTPLHTHTLDHISVVIHGSTLRDVAADGAAKENVQKAGDAVFVPGTGRTHSFANAGRETFESISIELK
jgi:quercetin dioxygenase-like cupin family protein